MTLKLERFKNAGKTAQAELIALFRRSFSTRPWTIKNTPNWKKVISELEGVDANIFVVKKGDETVGAVIGHSIEPNNPTMQKAIQKLGSGTHYYLHTIGVVPETRREGVANLLQRANTAQARKLHCKTIFSRTIASNTAMRKHFLKNGFRFFHKDRSQVYYRKEL